MLRPQTNAFRTALDCSGLWRFRPDPDGVGEDQGWRAGFDAGLDIAVPGSWNEQLAEAGLMNYVGGAWYQRDVAVPADWSGRRIVLRIGSADYRARLWVNGALVAENDVLCLPFEADIQDHVTPGEGARIVVWVSNAFTADTITQAVTLDELAAEGRLRDEYFPSVRFDFFPYGGLQRPVWMTCTPTTHIADIAVTTTLPEPSVGAVSVDVAVGGPVNTVRLVLEGDDDRWQVETAVSDGRATAVIDMDGCRPWSPDDPVLYELEVSALIDGNVVDVYRQPVGVREVRVEGGRLLLNGRPVRLRGFGKHEDAPIHGRGLTLPQMVKDFGLMRWIGANSFRTSHYPYAEEWLDQADRAGVLVISELPSINLDFRRVTDATLANHRRALAAQIARDRNHPCVIVWSLANEPGYLGEAEYHETAGDYWRTLAGDAKALDPSRPTTVANMHRVGPRDPAFDHVDVISLNRYYGWYDMPGQLDRATARLADELADIAGYYGKPILVSEFGADTLAGAHATTAQMFTEEYQADFLAAYCAVIEANDHCIGAHVWNFADFRTAQHHRRVIVNLKGVFTRTRDPKRAAFVLRELWSRPWGARHDG